ncbi:gluconate 2-dehydrogenase subunit 3 family protein [Flavisolibacter nicotianae]|uniref:gluconate 2-dehydrogenase subunit 3 family protein n=1 Tax=Flavisolibacter nicotianae TaxID=2364882 RepID=UPI000EAE7C7A|nr:gluconate 2-dehydrogenase subunit 3 family protein [Flavisolibacter nicotianae]
MERRTAVKYLFVIAGGTAVLPSCLHKENKASVLLKNIAVTADQETMLAEFAETLLPASSTPGAKDTYAHLHALRMMDQCFDKDAQKKFTGGMKEVESMMKKAHNTTFAGASAAQRSEILTALENKKASEDALQFYKLMKNLTIQGYLTSKPVLGDIFHYELVPGRYNGAFPVKTIIHQA